MRLLLCILKGINEENAIDYRQLCLLPSSGLQASPHLPACYLKLVRDLENCPCASVWPWCLCKESSLHPCLPSEEQLRIIERTMKLHTPQFTKETNMPIGGKKGNSSREFFVAWEFALSSMFRREEKKLWINHFTHQFPQLSKANDQFLLKLKLHIVVPENILLRP